MSRLSTNTRRSIEACVRRLTPAGTKLFLFGSFARGDAERSSDIDLALALPDDTRDDLLALVLAEIEREATTVRDVDLIDLRRAPESLRDRIEQEGLQWL